MRESHPDLRRVLAFLPGRALPARDARPAPRRLDGRARLPRAGGSRRARRRSSRRPRSAATAAPGSRTPPSSATVPRRSAIRSGRSPPTGRCGAAPSRGGSGASCGAQVSPAEPARGSLWLERASVQGLRRRHGRRVDEGARVAADSAGHGTPWRRRRSPGRPPRARRRGWRIVFHVPVRRCARRRDLLCLSGGTYLKNKHRKPGFNRSRPRRAGPIAARERQGRTSTQST